MMYTINYAMSELITYGYEIIHAYEQDENITIGESHGHGYIALNIYCDNCSLRYADRIAASILEHSNSVFMFTGLKIHIICDGNLIGMFGFDCEEVIFRPTISNTRPYSLLEDEAYCDKVEEELKMKEPAKIVFNGGVIFAATPTIEKIHISGPCTIIIWSDKTKTMVRLQEGEAYDAEKAVYAAIAKKFIGTNKNKSNWLDIIREKMPDESHNDAFYGVEKSDIQSVKLLLNSIYGAHKDEIEELRKAFEEEHNDKTETNGLTDSEPDISADDSVSGD